MMRRYRQHSRGVLLPHPSHKHHFFAPHPQTGWKIWHWKRQIDHFNFSLLHYFHSEPGQAINSILLRFFFFFRPTISVNLLWLVLHSKQKKISVTCFGMLCEAFWNILLSTCPFMVFRRQRVTLSVWIQVRGVSVTWCNASLATCFSCDTNA